MNRLELRIFPTNGVTLPNSDFRFYTQNWESDGATGSTSGRSLSDSGTTSYTTLSGWKWINGWMASQSAITSKLYQYFDASTLEDGQNYTLEFDIKNLTNPSTITPWFMGYSGTSTMSNGRYSYTFQYNAADWTGTTIDNRILFAPSRGFDGYLSNISLTETNSSYAHVNLYDEDSINITYQVYTDISTLSASYSKTFTVPATANNNKLFGHVNENQYYNFATLNSGSTNYSMFLNKKIPAGIFYDSVQLLIGTLELTLIRKNNNVSEYEATFYSNLKTFKDKIGDKQLVKNELKNDNLDFSEYDHTFNFTNISSTWNTSGTAYPFANYPNSKGVYYPMIDLQGKYWDNKYDVSYFKPSLYISEIWDKIFAKAGYTYSSAFLTSPFFKSLILPMTDQYESDPLDSSYYKFDVGLTSDFNGSNNPPTYCANFGNQNGHGFKDFFDVSDFNVGGGEHTHKTAIPSLPYEYVDPNNVFANQYFTCPTNGISYTFSLDASLSLYLETYWAAVNHGNYTPYGQTWYTGTVYKWNVAGNWGEIRLDVEIHKISGTGATDTVIGNFPQCPITQPNSYTNPYYQTNIHYSGTIDTPIPLLKNDKVYLKFIVSNNGNAYGYMNGSEIQRIGYTYAWVNLESSNLHFKNDYDEDGIIYEGNQMYANHILPSNMKQVDFLKSISNMFNLVFTEDNANKNNFIIETFPTFYNNTNVDWSNKVDISEDIEIERIEDLLDKDVYLQYKSDDGDTNLKDYLNATHMNFSTKYLPNPYYSAESQKIETQFCPTTLNYFSNTNWLVSQMYNKDDRDSNHTDNKEVWFDKFEARILQRKIVTPTFQLNQVPIISHLDGNNIYYPDGFVYYIMGTGSLNYIPYAGIFDDPYNPTKSIEFGKNKYYFHRNVNVPVDDLYWDYWKYKIWLYQNPRSRKLTVYMRLSQSDINQLNFRKYVILNNEPYILLKINEWSPNKYCKVELIKLTVPDDPDYYQSGGSGSEDKSRLNQNGVTKSSGIVLQSQGQIAYLETGVTYYSDKNIVNPKYAGIVIGKGNQIYGENYNVTGNNNVINANNVSLVNSHGNTVNSDNVTLMNSTDCIISTGLTNIIIIGTTGKTITDNNTIIIGNNIVSISGFTSGTDGTSGTSGTSPIVATTGSDPYYVKYTSPTSVGNGALSGFTASGIESVACTGYLDIRKSVTIRDDLVVQDSTYLSGPLNISGVSPINFNDTTTNTINFFDHTTAPSTASGAASTTHYGSGTNYLGTPSGWVLIQVAGVSYKLPYY